ncbi:MAG: ATP-binding protein [Deltaproteobacteria bacterium]|nr:ATP-binding protein [Deltaproteobacteria bacterium]
MKGSDVPQADSLDRVREVVRAVADGASDRALVGRAAGLSVRHVDYYVHAAIILGLLRRASGRLLVTREGASLLAATARSDEETRLLRSAVKGSRVVQELAPGLLEGPEPPLHKVQGAISACTRLAPATAGRRAKTLLQWRRRVLSPRSGQLPLPGDGGRGDLGAPAVVVPAPPQASGRTHEPAAGTATVLSFDTISVERYGPLRQVSVWIETFSVLVGSNATGKSTFMDSVAFVADSLRAGVGNALASRASTLQELLWLGEGDSFAFAFELRLPAALVASPRRSRARYELQVGRLDDGSAGVLGEALYLKPSGTEDGEPCVTAKKPGDWHAVIRRTPAGNARYEREKRGWQVTSRVDPKQLALAALPEDRERFPAANRVRDLFQRGVQRFVLDAAAMAKPSSPLVTGRLLPDGSNFARVVQRLAARDPEGFGKWIDHLREALPGIEKVRIVEREEDKHVYAKVRFKGGLDLPTWRLSDGTLRIMALTLLPFACEDDAVFLIEEPENGIHPQAVEAVYQALSSASTAQIVVATHSPVLLGVVPPDQLLCFSLEAGATSIQRSGEHPVLKAWRRDVDLPVLFATGVLG